jgi:hypothetical protein
MEGRVEKASVSRAAGAGDGRRGAPHAGQARAPAGRRSVHARQDGARGGGGKEVVVNEVMAGSSSSESRIITSAAAAIQTAVIKKSPAVYSETASDLSH